MLKTFAATAGTVALLAAPALAAAPGSVTGTVTAANLRTSANLVVSLDAPGLKVTPPSAPVVIDQKDMHFVPHVVAIVKGGTVKWLNDDTVAHNVFSPEGGYDLGTWQHGQSKEHTFAKPGVYTQLCRLHPEMEGFVDVLATPYFAVTSADGTFDIKGVPPGTYTLHVWSEKLKGVTKKITVESGKPATVDLTLTK
jgi:plastocyanin